MASIYLSLLTGVVLNANVVTWYVFAQRNLALFDANTVYQLALPEHWLLR